MLTNDEIMVHASAIKGTVANMLRRTRFYSEIDDAYGDIMVQVFEYAAKAYDGAEGGNVRGFLTTFTYRRMLNWLKRSYRKFECVGAETDTAEAEMTATASLRTATYDAAVLRRALKTLDSNQMTLLEAFYQSGSWKTAAAQCDISYQVAMKMRKKMAAHLGAEMLQCPEVVL